MRNGEGAIADMNDQGVAAVGPDLTHANRADRNYLLVSIVDPSSVIRREYVSYRLETKDGRVLTGGGGLARNPEPPRSDFLRGEPGSSSRRAHPDPFPLDLLGSNV